jgi:DNA polymerase
MEFDFFKTIKQKDVNNYVAIPYGNLYNEKGKPNWKCKGAYTKELSPIDNDLPILNKAVVDYLVQGIAVETTINNADKLIDFQKIVRLSSKYEYVEHNDTKYTYKSYRVFASKRRSDGTIYKCRNGQKPAKFGNTPRRCFIENGNILGMGVPPELDREWYIQTARDRLEQYGVTL